MSLSVYITSYNQAAYLREAIESVLNQTLLPDEIIIVDDSSNDESRELILDYCSRHPDLIKYKFHRQNEGIAKTRHDALDLVNCDYVTYVDGDDRLMPDKLRKEYAVFEERADVGIVYSNNVYMTECGRHHVYAWVDDENVPVGNVFNEVFGRYYPRRSLYRMEMVNFKLWKKVGFHDLSLKLYEDYDMRIRLSKTLKAVYVNEILAEIRMHAHGLSKTDIEEHLDALEYIFLKNFHLLTDLGPKDRKAVVNGFMSWYSKACLTGIHRRVKEVQFPAIYKLAVRLMKFRLRAKTIVLRSEYN